MYWVYYMSGGTRYKLVFQSHTVIGTDRPHYRIPTTIFFFFSSTINDDGVIVF